MGLSASAPRILPALDDVNRPFWTGGHRGQLLIEHCARCDRWQHPPRGSCESCGGEVVHHAVSGRGTVFTFTVNSHQYHPDVPPPYVIAMFQGAPRRGSMPQILPGGILTTQEWRFHRPFRIGEELTAVSQVIDLRDRLGGRYGYSVLVTTSTEFTDATGEPVGAVLITVTQFDPAGLRERV